MKTAQELGIMADDYAAKRELRLARKKEVDELEKEEHAMKEALIAGLREAELTAVGGQQVSISIKPSKKAVAENWDAVFKYIRETGEFDLLYRRVNEAALKERLDSGVHIPGINWFPVDKISISKVKKG